MTGEQRQKAVEEWWAQQTDLIECPLGAKIRLQSCMQRQAWYHGSTDPCELKGCEHFRTKENRSWEELRRMTPGLTPIRTEAMRGQQFHTLSTPTVCDTAIFASEDGPEPVPQRRPSKKMDRFAWRKSRKVAKKWRKD